MNNVIKEVSLKLQEKKLKISFAESCTGGALVSALVSVPGASNILEESYVTYSEESKKKVLNVKEETLSKYTVYSKEVAYEMCEGLYELTHSDVCVSITGHAGGSECVYNGIAYVCVRYMSDFYELTLEEKGDRETTRTKFVTKVFDIIDWVI